MADEVGGVEQIVPEGVQDSTCLQGLGNEGGTCPQELGPYLNELKTKQKIIIKLWEHLNHSLRKTNNNNNNKKNNNKKKKAGVRL